jgi:superfamily II DNA or RNA helicase
MIQLEQMTTGSRVTGMRAACAVSIIAAEWLGPDAVRVAFRDDAGGLGEELLDRSDEARLSLQDAALPWSFTADGDLFRLVFEAQRIRWAHLFDPMMAVHLSRIMPLPHQITAVYGEMLTRQPLRFLLADDPGAGKTIMAGLLIRELMLRGDLARCLIVSPGSLTEQWQDELYERFDLEFDLFTSDQFAAAGPANWFQRHPYAICRMDKLARDEAVQERLLQIDWDLIVVDEAHKMSASYYGSELKRTQRYRLGEQLSSHTRHLLLMTATPHSGIEANFQLFLALLDGDRFEGRSRDAANTADAGDLMRRLVKERLVKMDGTPLFPERRAHTVNYKLSEAEAALYNAVTAYVRTEFDRADALDENTRNNVGFALTSLQRRLASSPEAIYRSLMRRRERLERRLRESELQRRGVAQPTPVTPWTSTGFEGGEDGLPDPEELTGAEREDMEEGAIDEASAARSIAELRAEIASLQLLERQALAVRRSGTDRKWEELSSLLQERPELFDAGGGRRKLVVFTEHRDTLNYLRERIATLIGRPDAIEVIHGAMARDDRRRAQEAFRNDPEVVVLVATDAAGEGINLQRAHLMVNYDLPWNPNRLEQRFGRIHRIGQLEVCHLWNLVAEETREGDVYLRLLHKLDEERGALFGQVFDVLGQVFTETPLWKLLQDAVRYGDDPEVRARLYQVVDGALDREHIARLLKERALTDDALDASLVTRVRNDMERAQARRLQPFYIETFFREAFAFVGGSLAQREPGRYEISHVPAPVRERGRTVGIGPPVTARYERVAFERANVDVPGKPPAALLCPGHPLMEAVLSLLLDRLTPALKQGAVLIDEHGSSEPRLLVALMHEVRDGRPAQGGGLTILSRRMQFVEIRTDGTANDAGHAPYLDYRTASEAEGAAARSGSVQWTGPQAEQAALAFAAQHMVPRHFDEVAGHQQDRVARTRAAVNSLLTSEITYWDGRARELRDREDAGKTARMNAVTAERRRDDLIERLQRRMRELDAEAQLSKGAPIVLGAALVVPASALSGGAPAFGHGDPAVELAAMEAVMAAERAAGHDPHDVSGAHVGYDIESRTRQGALRFIEVKGRTVGAATVTVTRNEILTALNAPEQFLLAIVRVDGAERELRFVTKPFRTPPDRYATSVNYDLDDLWERGAGAPSPGGLGGWDDRR